MDESTLNDLLECSVCLERLDTSSKVLPCQHTFCRKCLEVIVASRQELRCPECRVLVSVKIDDLPPNVLLMRILENLKSATVKPQQDDQIGKVQQAENFEQKLPTTSQTTQQQLNKQQSSSSSRRLLPHAYALYDFDSTEPNDLHFKKGELILLKHKIDVNWYIGQLNGVEGTFPSNYVQVMVPLPSPQCIALYDFKMGANEEEGCLSFKKGTVIHVLRRVDDNWAEGRIGNMIGIFPIAFVELNSLARHLLGNVEQKVIPSSNSNNQTLSQSIRNLPPPMPLIDPTTSPLSSSQSNTTSPTSASDSASSNNRITSNATTITTTTTTTTTTNSSNASLNSNSMPSSPHQSLPTTPQHYAHGSGSVRYRNSKEKRHSLNALLSSGSSSGIIQPALSILQTNRHSAEILSIPSEELILTNNSEFAISGQSSELHSQNAAEPQTTASRELQESVSIRSGSITSTRANVLKSVCGHSNIPPSLPWGYLALYPYKPRKNDELELKKGCVYIVTERCLDGWFKGKNWQDVSGVFPGNYVTPLRARDQQQLMHQWRFVPQPMSHAISTHVGQNSAAGNKNLTSAIPKHHTPPELPPRHLIQTTTTCASVWTKPLSHTVEAFFNRGSTSGKIITNQNSASSSTNDKSKEKEPKSKDSLSTSAAVTLMKRLTNIKSRAKSPASTARQTREQQISPNNDSDQIKLEEITDNSQNNATQLSKMQPVHVRSGSCPSQLLQSLPLELSNSQKDERLMRAQQQQPQPQQHVILQHGSERIKGHKERPRIPATRQSMDGTLRSSSSSIYNNIPANQTALPPFHHAIPNSLVLNSKCAQQLQIGNTQDIYATPHRKSQSLDATNIHIGSSGALPMLPPSNASTAAYSMQNSNIAAAITASATTKSAHCGRESRFRCIVPYPPNSDVELELHVGDIIYVQRKQKNGWYKGTHARTQKTGLFPASFVEPDF